MYRMMSIEGKVLPVDTLTSAVVVIMQCGCQWIW